MSWTVGIMNCILVRTIERVHRLHLHISKGELHFMKITPKYIHKLAMPLLALGMAVTLSPALKAQVQAQTAAQSSASTTAAPETQQRLEDLEKEVSILQREIVTLKESDNGTPTMRTAALVEPIAQGQAPADAATAPAATPAPAAINLAGLLGPTTFSGYVDAYYSFNFNQPGNLGGPSGPNGIDGNGLQFFDENTNQFSLNSIEAVVDRAPDATAGGTGRAGYHIGIIYGQAAEAINGGNSTDRSNLALKEAYVDYIAPIGKGLTLTFGKFVTPAGAEVIETNGNWNYSRSILFYYAIPYFHFGANAKYTFNSQWAVTGYLVNGWNNSQEVNTGKTYGVSIAYTPTKLWAITENYMAGPQDDVALGTGYVGKPNDNYRQLSDTVITYSPNAKWNYIVNGDYGYGDKVGNFVTTKGNSKAVDWWGAAGYVKYAPDAKSYIAVRGEYFSDPEGFAVPQFPINGYPSGHAGEGTATYAYNWTSGLQSRAEFREDYSNRGIFEKGGRFVKTQPILTFGLIYTFNSTNAK
jgi:Putative beta-barrel porin-2, OmpL-like. bbp2